MLRNIAGQVFDSPPDMNGIADGIAKSMGIGGVRESMIRSAVSCYLRATEASAGKEYAASSAAFRANPIDAPSLWYYSHGDDVSRAEDCAEVAGGWRARGAEVHEVVYGRKALTSSTCARTRTGTRLGWTHFWPRLAATALKSKTWNTVALWRQVRCSYRRVPNRDV